MVHCAFFEFLLAVAPTEYILGSNFKVRKKITIFPFVNTEQNNPMLPNFTSLPQTYTTDVQSQVLIHK